MPAIQNSGMVPEKVQAILAEYATLREEIGRRSTHQLLAVTGSLISAGTLLGIISGDPAKFGALLLVIPWVLSVFGITWLDHAEGIHLIGLYIREIESKKLPGLLMSDEGSTIGWETYLHTLRAQAPLLGYINLILPLVYFFLPSIVALVAYGLLRFTTVTKLPAAIEWSLVGVGLVLVMAMLYCWYRALRTIESTRLVKNR